MPRQSRAPILLIRPEPQNAAFAARLAAPVVRAPLFDMRRLTPDLPPAAAVVFTSANAIVPPAVAPRAWCVGDRTADAARRAGYDAISAQGDAEALVAAILASNERGPLLHLRGRDSRGDVARRLTDAGVPTVERVIYDMQPRPLSPEGQALLDGAAPVIVPLFSPAAAGRFAAVAAGARAPLCLPCLSPAVARAAPPGLVRVCPRPDAAAMLEAILAMRALETSGR
ncbi:uroporphyrinogen-III synthase [Falsirhodobacter halotolerans]|uniref:uroporphyrinogen-III synthase n=1 Tax=Falsirhodobacter halotolerans TaxID=1146892 RepID=UPI001FD52D68|nr:uroporphyrinogen-III synthase [Falsirhodobacter halotolerans]MCJ8140788.1 uroporphyrinogen-III synthase [Falsirhodobacter halotolerans]